MFHKKQTYNKRIVYDDLLPHNNLSGGSVIPTSQGRAVVMLVLIR
jgi:hypothetical protein